MFSNTGTRWRQTSLDMRFLNILVFFWWAFCTLRSLLLFQTTARGFSDDLRLIIGENIVNGRMEMLVRDGVFDQGEERLQGRQWLWRSLIGSIVFTGQSIFIVLIIKILVWGRMWEEVMLRSFRGEVRSRTWTGIVPVYSFTGAAGAANSSQRRL